MPEAAWDIVAGFWRVLSEMAPYLLFGFLMAGLLSVLISPRQVERHLGGRGFWQPVKAAAFGVPLPLCSCGVIPVSASLRRHGAGRGATTAFLISTPQTGVDSILVTLSLLGPVFAVFRPVAALVSGVVGGLIVGLIAPEAQPAPGSGQACRDACCAVEGGPGRLRRGLRYGFDVLPRDIGRSLLVGLVLAALISALVPKDFFAPVLGGGIGAMLLMMLLGIPVYVCATASVPMAMALIAKGVSPGAAFAFLVTGPATNAATIATIWKVLGRRTAVVYLLTVALSALAGGLLLDQLVTVPQVAHAHEHGWMLPEWLTVASALTLLGVLAVAVVRRSPRAGDVYRQEVAEAEQRPMELRITGMTCSHCAETVQRALLEAPGVSWAGVDLSTGLAKVVGSGLDPTSLRQAVEGLGYGVADVSEGPAPGAAPGGGPGGQARPEPAGRTNERRSGE